MYLSAGYMDERGTVSYTHLDFNHLLDHVMKQLSLVCVCCFVVNFFPFSAAGNQSVRFQLAEMVRNCRTTHVHHGRNVDHTFFAVAEKPENAYPAVISEDLEQVSLSLIHI